MTSQLGMCHWTSVICDELLIHEPGHCSNRSVGEQGNRQVQDCRLHSAQSARRESGETASRKARRQIDGTVQGTGGLHLRETRGTVQTEPLQILSRIWMNVYTMMMMMIIDYCCILR